MDLQVKLLLTKLQLTNPKTQRCANITVLIVHRSLLHTFGFWGWLVEAWLATASLADPFLLDLPSLSRGTIIDIAPPCFLLTTFSTCMQFIQPPLIGLHTSG
jgi:hypothetical protein